MVLAISPTVRSRAWYRSRATLIFSGVMTGGRPPTRPRDCEPPDHSSLPLIAVPNGLVSTHKLRRVDSVPTPLPDGLARRSDLTIASACSCAGLRNNFHIILKPSQSPPEVPPFFWSRQTEESESDCFPWSASGPYRTRTCDPLRVMQVRYQLRQRPVGHDTTTRAIRAGARERSLRISPQPAHRAPSALSPYNWEA
jgi:hypothetical protein